ncbi:putative mitochondrial hypothetical protein [Leptomonas pyrrhocoris]|uniref:Uncharacterized protein n=1 Tax=Leptomonas pyrrhocoris TaxID=157538 RepID=A0A0M9FRY3_LEPPY|nr:putative mitochondrial hypothetical protein [Leptomonas pyrrhocoris]KPA74793.1 putative mitochondrial hypothetical protein [Leptomonas pyrrhocoris]|eukprot:XP_015653232.1 putative mitochondrial hypothetical protein [Leptomonas pyrrhocoris]
MLRLTSSTLARSFRANLKYPSLVSYNKLPWEVINHETTQLHLHLAPNYEQLLSLAAVTSVPHLTVPSHLHVPEAEQLRVLPGMLYLIGGEAGRHAPPGFTSYVVADPSALQYYGRLHHTIAPIQRVEMCTSADLRLLCLALHFEGVLANTTETSSLQQASSASQDGAFSLFYYFRPNRPANELTRPFEKFYQHRPSLASFAGLGSEKASGWSPVLQVPKRAGAKAALTPAEPYRPPQNYLMGLAERLAVRPGSAFGRRSLMWGTWF